LSLELPTDIPIPRSRRSSTARFTRSTYRQHTWRSSSLAETSKLVASVSIVFAEPEQGSPLAKASSTANVPLSPSLVLSIPPEEVDGNAISPDVNPRNEDVEANIGATIGGLPAARPYPSHLTSPSFHTKPSLPNFPSNLPPRRRHRSCFRRLRVPKMATRKAHRRFLYKTGYCARRRCASGGIHIP